MSLNEIFARIWKFILAVWNYPIPWESIGDGIRTFLLYALAMCGIAFAAFAAFKILSVLWDLLIIGYYLNRRLIKRAKELKAARGKKPS